MGAVFVGQLGKLRDGCQPSHSFYDAKRPAKPTGRRMPSRPTAPAKIMRDPFKVLLDPAFARA
jgi:hypothetical protein